MKSIYLAAAAAIGLAALPAGASPVDQSYLPTGPTSALTIDNNTTSRGQSFTVGLDGFLTGVRVNVSDKGNFDQSLDATLTVSIFDVTGGAISGSALASGTIGRTLGSTGLFDYKLAEVLFSSAIAVTAGEMYAIVLDGVDAIPNDGFYWAAGGDFNGYAGGMPFQEINGSLVQSGVADYQFQTLIDTTPADTIAPIPLPASLPLFLVGLGAIGFTRLRARS